MDMQQAWEDVEKMLQQVRPHLLRAGVPERQLSMPEAEPAEIRIERYLEIFDWLTALIASDEWTALMKVWKLRPERIWADYILHEIKGLQEQILLEKAQAGIRKRWKLDRPFFFGRKFKKGKPDGDDESSSDTQPETEAASEQDQHPAGASRSGVRSSAERPAQGHRRRGRSSVLHQKGAGVPGPSGGRKHGGGQGQHPKRSEPPRSGGGHG